MPQLQEARALWVKQDLFGALARFDRAAREHPRNVLALVDASRAFGAMYNYARAEELIARLVELARGDGKILHLAAQSYRILRRTDAAIDCFRQALAGRSPTSESHLELGLLYERKNQLDAALAQADARLRAQPKDAEGAFLKARVQRRLGSRDAAREGLQAIVKTPTAHWLTRGRAYAELAALFDEEQRYAEAWDAMLAGKKELAPHAREARAHRDRLVPPLLKVAQEVTREHFERWREGASSGGPRLALLTGMPRSGTTLLEQVLNAHPGIVAADEFDAFPRFIYPALLGQRLPKDVSPGMFDALAESFLAPQRDRYAAAMSAAVGRPLDGNWLLDKNPSLLPLVTPYLRFAPHARVIVQLRDPRDVLVSCLMAYLPLNDFSVDFLSPETAAERLVADLQAWCAFREKAGEACVEVWYEDLVADLRPVCERALQRLGLNWNDDQDRYREVAASRTVYSPSYDSVALPLHARAIGRWRNYEPQLSRVLPRLEQLLQQLR